MGMQYAVTDTATENKLNGRFPTMMTQYHVTPLSLGQPSLRPFMQSHRYWQIILSFCSQVVLIPSRPRLISCAIEQACLDQKLEPVGQNIGRDTEAALEIIVSPQAIESSTQNQIIPAVSQDIHGVKQRAIFRGVRARTYLGSTC